jgi:RNA polymerase sigma factor (sigma-70 family)
MALMTDAQETTSSATDWTQLYLRLRPNLTRALVAISGSYEAVEDSIQDAFVEAIGRKRDRALSIEGWLFTVALNRLRRSRRRARLFRPLLGDAQSGTRELDRVLDLDAALTALLRLNERDRGLLVAKYYVGLSQDEIAKAMRIPRGTVSAALSRAAAHLRETEEKR